MMMVTTPELIEQRRMTKCRNETEYRQLNRSWQHACRKDRERFLGRTWEEVQEYTPTRMSRVYFLGKTRQVIPKILNHQFEKLKTGMVEPFGKVEDIPSTMEPGQCGCSTEHVFVPQIARQVVG